MVPSTVSPLVCIRRRAHSRTFDFSALDTEFPYICGGAWRGPRRCKCLRRLCRATCYQVHEVVEEAFCAYHVGGVCEIGERVRTRGPASLTESGGSKFSGLIPTTKECTGAVLQCLLNHKKTESHDVDNILPTRTTPDLSRQTKGSSSVSHASAIVLSP
jgi:hypothetical protein